MPANPKCTRGDKCILLHIVLTLAAILILVLIYAIHISVVEHEGYDAFRITRRTSYQSVNTTADLRYEEADFLRSIGIAYIDASPRKVICNTILMRREWSLAPAHCVSIRSDPDLSQFLPKWKIRYKADGKFIETYIKSGIVHSYYNKDDFANNIGLLKHMNEIELSEFKFNDQNVSELFMRSLMKNPVIVGWRNVDDISVNRVSLLDSDKCSQFVYPIVEASRPGESCFMYHNRHDSRIDHGAALVLDSQIIGIFSWGDRRGHGVPLVILAIEPYRAWIENMMAL